MDQIFDLFGDPVPTNWGGRGRPQHIPTVEYRNKVKLLLAFGWSNGRIANALAITEPTLRKHYFSELKFRSEQRDRMDASLAARLWKEVEAGSVSAMKEFRKLVEVNDRMEIERAMGSSPARDAVPADRPGKKDLDRRRAVDADADLMAELEQEASQNAAVH